MARSVPALLAALALAGCAHEKIAGTEIEDTSDTRAIIDVMKKYRVAVEAKDVAGIASLLDTSFKDDGGSAGVDDDLDYATAPQKLAERFAKLGDVKLDLDIRKIHIKDDNANAVYHYNMRFLILVQNAKVPKADSDIKEMAFRRVDGAWKITSGI
ncbi:MAG TPA: DUF4440 domain-containing protein [Myxococcaceae bacterium]|nr:DUF4440 domain-containing protein [Myxococcaceae bacterium]